MVCEVAAALSRCRSSAWAASRAAATCSSSWPAAPPRWPSARRTSPVPRRRPAHRRRARRSSCASAACADLAALRGRALADLWRAAAERLARAAPAGSAAGRGDSAASVAISGGACALEQARGAFPILGTADADARQTAQHRPRALARPAHGRTAARQPGAQQARPRSRSTSSAARSPSARCCASRPSSCSPPR